MTTTQQPDECQVRVTQLCKKYPTSFPHSMEILALDIYKCVLNDPSISLSYDELNRFIAEMSKLPFYCDSLDKASEHINYDGSVFKACQYIASFLEQIRLFEMKTVVLPSTAATTATSS